MNQSRTQFVILSLLRIQPLSGNEIRDFCNTRFSYFWQESYGQIYPNLAQLTKQGEINKIPNAKKRGTQYEITDSGRQKLVGWVEEASMPRVIRDELFLKLFCGSVVDNSRQLAHIEEAKIRAEKEMSGLDDAMQEIELMEGMHPDVPYWCLILRAGVLSLGARLKWCREADELIRGMNN